jgi:hypothetical protein
VPAMMVPMSLHLGFLLSDAEWSPTSNAAWIPGLIGYTPIGGGWRIYSIR